jgi:hypothetical protein
MALTGPRRVRAAIMAFAGPAAVAVAADRGWLARADRAGFRAVLASRCPAGTAVAQAVSALAEPGGHWPADVVAGWDPGPRARAGRA